MFSRKYCTEVTNLTTLSVFEVEIWCFRGGDTIPKWILRNQGQSISCTTTHQSELDSHRAQITSPLSVMFARICHHWRAALSPSRARTARLTGQLCSALRSTSV